ncbi:MAG: V-type ATPase subunit, partial [Thermoplasmata archaeon]|nr:V-type ATPase subunit [Thermoplasmata archaeon]
LGGMVLGRPVQVTELGLVSWRELPAGVAAGALTFDDLRALIGQPTVEAAVNYLVKFGYGPVLLPLVENFVRTRDVFTLTQALERDYYARLLASLKYFQGDEWVVREFLKAEIDERNVELLLKAKDAELAQEEVSARWTEGGGLGAAAIPELYQARSVPELATALAPRYPVLHEGLPAYQASKSLTGFESALLRDRVVREVRRMRAYPLSLAILTTYLLRAEAERSDLRRIVYGKVYGVTEAQVEPFLVSPRIG